MSGATPPPNVFWAQLQCMEATPSECGKGQSSAVSGTLILQEHKSLYMDCFLLGANLQLCTISTDLLVCQHLRLSRRIDKSALIWGGILVSRLIHKYRLFWDLARQSLHVCTREFPHSKCTARWKQTNTRQLFFLRHPVVAVKKKEHNFHMRPTRKAFFCFYRQHALRSNIISL
jgi:hypothetical protein